MPNMMGMVRQSLRFGAVGVINTGIGLTAIYGLMYFFEVGPALANAVGYTIGLGVSFALNRVWTFNNNQPVAHVLPKYLLTAAICYLLNLGVVVASTSSYLSVNAYLAQLAGIAVYTACLFSGCRWYVFTTPSSTT